MFTTGGVLLPFFAFLTGLIGVPTGVKFFNWIGTMWGGSITYESPMLYSIGFLICFLIGGINGVVTASVPVDFAVHDTYLVVSHIHYVLFGGSIFAALAGLIFWFPKMFGRKLNETWLKISFWMMFIAMNVTFFPMHLLGLDGMPRRVATYAGSTGWGPINFVETLSAYFIGISLLLFLVNVIVTLMKPKDQPADPWQSNTLEWWATSPPKPYNFDDLPPINSERPVWDARQAGLTSRAAEGTTGA
jgi:cytochrome c oxidase subunit 1